jgi:hypothetical protein
MPGKKGQNKQKKQNITPPPVLTEPPNAVEDARRAAALERAAKNALKPPPSEPAVAQQAQKKPKKPHLKPAERFPWDGLPRKAQIEMYRTLMQDAEKKKFRERLMGLTELAGSFLRRGNMGTFCAINDLMAELLALKADNKDDDLRVAIARERTAVQSAYYSCGCDIELIKKYWC